MSEIVLNISTGETSERPFTPVPIDFAQVDQDNLNDQLAAEGSVVRALALVLLQEINTLRSKVIPPLPAYNTTQLVAALKAKMRN